MSIAFTVSMGQGQVAVPPCSRGRDCIGTHASSRGSWGHAGLSTGAPNISHCQPPSAVTGVACPGVTSLGTQLWLCRAVPPVLWGQNSQVHVALANHCRQGGQTRPRQGSSVRTDTAPSQAQGSRGGPVSRWLAAAGSGAGQGQADICAGPASGRAEAMLRGSARAVPGLL